MRSAIRYAYIDRRTGKVTTDPIYASAFMEWCYATYPGYLLTRLILNREFFSRLYGWYYRQSWTRRKIPAFATAMGVDFTELTMPLNTFGSFSAFISRKIDLSKREINSNPDVCVSPADGRMMAFQQIDAASSFHIKNGWFDLRTLLQDDALAERFDGGSLTTFRLYLADYHHFHFPASGLAREPRSIPGRYYATSPYSTNRTVPYFGANHRMLTLLDSDCFGLIAMLEIGAFTVGSIRQRFTPGVWVVKGGHKGWFELGGSALAMLFEKGAIRLDADLCANTRNDMETFVRLGESIGTSEAIFVEAH